MAQAASRRAARAQQWYLAAAAVAAKLWPDLASGSYVCPLCTGVYTLADLDAGLLTREHVPPASVGGREIVLTCRDCNNRAGATFDAHLERAEALRRFGSADPLRGLDVTLSVRGIPNRGTMYATDDGILVAGNAKQNNPADVAAIIDRFGELAAAGDPIHVAFRDSFHPRLVQLGFVRAAYLAAFAVLGYAYVLRPSFDPIRASLSGDDDESLLLPVLMRGDRSGLDRSIGIAAEPGWLAGAVLVAIGPVVVILPPLDGAGDPIGEVAARRELSPGDFHGTFRTSPAWRWPTEPQHGLDRYLVDQLGGSTHVQPG